jgi:hypothetical protein
MESVNWFDVAQNRNQCGVAVNIILNFPVPEYVICLVTKHLPISQEGLCDMLVFM